MDNINLLDPALFVARQEHDLFARLRAEDPVHFHAEADGGPGFWAVTRYDDCKEMLLNHEVFINGKGTQIKDKRAEGHGAPSIHNMDAPRHAKMRARGLAGIRRSHLADLAGDIAVTIDRLLDDCPRGETFDFVEKVALPLPMLVIGELLGVPEADRPLTVDWANTMTNSLASEAEHVKARGELFSYFRDLVARKRADPGNDFATILSKAEIDGEALTEEELDAWFMVLTAAGNETTRFLVSGGVEQLCLAPDQMAALREDIGLIPAAVEEMARWVSPVMMMRRTAAADIELGGKSIKAGDKVVAYFVSANRDESVFYESQKFDSLRRENPHLGFGIGAHFCFGAPVARLEAKLLFEKIFDRFKSVELVEPGTKIRSNWFSGYSALPVRWS